MGHGKIEVATGHNNNRRQKKFCRWPYGLKMNVGKICMWILPVIPVYDLKIVAVPGHVELRISKTNGHWIFPMKYQSFRH